VKLLSFVEEIQAVASIADDRGRRIGAGGTLDFSSTTAPSRTAVCYVCVI
jgi:hypothetical protein